MNDIVPGRLTLAAFLAEPRRDFDPNIERIHRIAISMRHSREKDERRLRLNPFLLKRMGLKHTKWCGGA